MLEGILRFGLTCFCALLVHDWIGFEGTVIIMLAAILFRLSVISEYLQEPASEDANK